MKRNIFIAMTAVLLFAPRVCFAGFNCDPSEFTLEKSDRTGLHLKGIIKTPVPGYTYELDADDSDSSPAVIQLTLNLEAPAGEALQAETPLEISGDIDTKGDEIKVVNIDIIKEFNSGPIKISCRSEDAKKEPVTE